MQYYDGKDMARSFRTVCDNTIKLADEIPEDKYSFKPAEGSRSVAETLAHLAISPRIAIKIHSSGISQIDFAFFMAEFGKLKEAEAALTTKAQILAELRTGGDQFVALLEGMSDEVLGQQVHFPPQVTPPVKTRFEMLLASKEHEMHHRAQLMVIERMIGIVPHLTRDFEARRAQLAEQQQAATQSA